MSAKFLSYFDDYKHAMLECPKCHWQGTFEQGFVDYSAEVMDCTFPKCDVLHSPILAIVGYPTLEEARANSDRPGIREWVQQIDSRLDLFEAQKLRTVEQLPEISEDSFTLIWDFECEEHGNNARTLIKHQGVTIFSEPGRWEGYERYEEVAEILKQRYGDRIKDLVPTLESEYYLCGDDGKSYDFVDRVRIRLFVGNNTLTDWAGFYPPLRPKSESLTLPTQLWLFS